MTPGSAPRKSIRRVLIASGSCTESLCFLQEESDFLLYFAFLCPSSPDAAPCVCSVSQSCPTPCDPMDCTPRCSSAHGILVRARMLEWVAIPFARASSRCKDWTPGPLPCRRILQSSPDTTAWHWECEVGQQGALCRAVPASGLSPGGGAHGAGRVANGPEGSRTGQKDRARGRRGHARGRKGSRTGPEGSRTGPEGSRTGPEGSRTGSEGSRTGPNRGAAPKPGPHAAPRAVWRQLTRTHSLPSGVGDCASRKCHHSHWLHFQCFFCLSPTGGMTVKTLLQISGGQPRAESGWEKHDFADAPLRGGVFYAPSLFQIFVSAFSLPNRGPGTCFWIPQSQRTGRRIWTKMALMCSRYLGTFAY